MSQKDFKIYIVGAGVSGLVAAQVLKKKDINRLFLKHQTEQEGE